MGTRDRKDNSITGGFPYGNRCATLQRTLKKNSSEFIRSQILRTFENCFQKVCNFFKVRYHSDTSVQYNENITVVFVL